MVCLRELAFPCGPSSLIPAPLPPSCLAWCTFSSHPSSWKDCGLPRLLQWQEQPSTPWDPSARLNCLLSPCHAPGLRDFYESLFHFSLVYRFVIGWRSEPVSSEARVSSTVHSPKKQLLRRICKVWWAFSVQAPSLDADASPTGVTGMNSPKKANIFGSFSLIQSIFLKPIKPWNVQSRNSAI